MGGLAIGVTPRSDPTVHCWRGGLGFGGATLGGCGGFCFRLSSRKHIGRRVSLGENQRLAAI